MENSAKKDYSDMLHLPHHQSRLHPQMPLQERAAQFTPFSALTGLDEALQEARQRKLAQVEAQDSRRCTEEE